MVSDAGEDVAKVALGVEAAELGGLDEGEDAGGTVAAAVRPAKSQFLRPRATGRIARSAALLSISMRPSPRYRHSASQRVSA
jgi:hypothetical protein